MRFWTIYFSVVIAVLGALAIAGLLLLYSWSIKPLIATVTTIQQSHFKLYQEDLVFLAKAPFLKSLMGVNEATLDAGKTLNPKIYWSPTSPSSAFHKNRLVPEDTQAELLRMGSGWIENPLTARRLKAELSLFSELGRFDHWNIESNSPLESLTKDARFVPPTQKPIPETSDLIAAVKIRLMRAALDNDYLDALHAARNLSRLLITTENTQLVIAGLAILDYERIAYHYYVREKKFPADLWQPIDPATTARANRAVLATRGYLRLITNPTLLDKTFLGSQIPLGFCAATNEAFPFEYSLRPLLEPRVPLETNNKEAYARLDRIYARAQKVCRIQYLRALVRENSFSRELPGPFLLNRLPFSRRVFGMKTETSNFSGFQSYNELAAGTQRSEN